MKLTRQEEIAVLLVSSLAQKPTGYISLSVIAEQHSVSPLFLKKIARLLRHHGVISSREGINGGYILSKDPKDIRVIDIFRAVTPSGKNMEKNEELRRMRCPIGPGCIPQRIHALITNTLMEYLSDLTVDQFLAKEKLL